MIIHITILKSKDNNGQPVKIGKLDKARHGLMRAHNDRGTILGATVEELRQSERDVLSEYACGDVDERPLLAELSIIRKSLLAKGCKEYLKVMN